MLFLRVAVERASLVKIPARSWVAGFTGCSSLGPVYHSDGQSGELSERTFLSGEYSVFSGVGAISHLGGGEEA